MRTTTRLQLFVRKLKSLRSDVRGSLIVVTALVLPALLAFLGLSVDFGMVFDTKRRQQNAANAGAMGGAYELLRLNEDYAEVAVAAKADTKRNGFDHDAGNVEVTVNYPYTCFNGDANCVEVIVDQTIPTFFISIFGSDSIAIQSRAVAGLMAGAGDGCIYVLDRTERDSAFKVPGTATVAADCEIMVNSTHDRAVRNVGGGCINATSIGVTGGSNMQSSCPAPPVTYMPQTSDPMWMYDCTDSLAVCGSNFTAQPHAYTEEPVAGIVSGSAYVRNDPTGLLEEWLDPGIYMGGITLQGGTYHLNPRIYIMDGGGFSAVSDTIIDGTNVLIYNTNTTGNDKQWGHIKIGAQTQATFIGRTEGYYQGFLFWNDRDMPDLNPGASILGTSFSSFEGVMYFPSVHLKFRGDSEADGWNMVIANTLSIAGTAESIASKPDFANSTTGMPSLLKRVTLME